MRGLVVLLALAACGIVHVDAAGDSKKVESLEKKNKKLLKKLKKLEEEVKALRSEKSCYSLDRAFNLTTSSASSFMSLVNRGVARVSQDLQPAQEQGLIWYAKRRKMAIKWARPKLKEQFPSMNFDSEQLVDGVALSVASLALWVFLPILFAIFVAPILNLLILICCCGRSRPARGYPTGERDSFGGGGRLGGRVY